MSFHWYAGFHEGFRNKCKLTCTGPLKYVQITVPSEIPFTASVATRKPHTLLTDPY